MLFGTQPWLHQSAVDPLSTMWAPAVYRLSTHCWILGQFPALVSRAGEGRLRWTWGSGAALSLVLGSMRPLLAWPGVDTHSGPCFWFPRRLSLEGLSSVPVSFLQWVSVVAACQLTCPDDKDPDSWPSCCPACLSVPLRVLGSAVLLAQVWPA